MARKLPRLQRVLDAPALFSIAYGEIASSIYFALGIIALHALGFTPLVLLATGLLFLIVSLSYAEGTAAIRETGGAATFVRIAFNDFWGFITGWVLFLDYLIVIALSALFMPHYVAGAFFTKIHRPWDVVAGCGVIAGVAVIRLVHRTRLHRWALMVALVDLATQLLIVVLGMALLFSPGALTAGTSLGTSPDVALDSRSRSRSRCSRTRGSRRSPTSRRRRGVPAATYRGVCSAASAWSSSCTSRSPSSGSRRSRRSTARCSAATGSAHRSWASSSEIRAHVPDVIGVPLQVFVGLSGALILLTAATTSISGFGRLAYSLGEHGQLPRRFGMLSAAHARRAAVDHRRRADLDRAARRNRSARASGPLPCEPLQLRRPARLHRRAARRDQTEVQRTEPQASRTACRSRWAASRAVGRRRGR